MFLGGLQNVSMSRGKAEFQSVCMDVTERYHAKKLSESKRYLQALADVYTKIFEFNLDANTVKCLYCEEMSYFKRFENIAMQMEDALEKWVIASVASAQQDAVRQFFKDFCQRRLYGGDGKPPQITYQARSTGRQHQTIYWDIY